MREIPWDGINLLAFLYHTQYPLKLRTANWLGSIYNPEQVRWRGLHWQGTHLDDWTISFPELRSPWPAVGKRELWEHPFWNITKANLVPRGHDHLVSDGDRDLWPGPTPKVRNSRTSRHSAHAQSQVWQIWLVLIYCVYTAIHNRNVVGPGQGTRYFQRMIKGTPRDEVEQRQINVIWLTAQSQSASMACYGACLKWMLPELSFSDHWSGTNLWERDWWLFDLRSELGFANGPCYWGHFFSMNTKSKLIALDMRSLNESVASS